MYYAGSPIISDEQFDRLAEATSYDNLGSAVHGDVEQHVYKMYSLQKHYADEGEHPLKGYSNITITPKIDGAAIDVLYIDGELVRVLTRGDGIEGRNVTDRFLATKLIPHHIEGSGVIQVTGEIAAPKTVENARNYAAGALNLGSVEEFKTRALEFFAYGVQPYQTATFDGDMAVLREWGFSTVQDPHLDQIYPTDGVVFRLNDNQTFEELGYTSKHPRGAYALKERSEVVETTLLSVEWQVGKSGKVTPVAILEPVLVGDATISRATLNNPGFIRALDLQVGDRVAIRRSGEVIPQIVHKIE